MKKLANNTLITTLLLLSMVVSIFGYSSFANAKGKESYKSSYIEYVKQQQKKTKKTLYYSIVDASEDGMPVLLITDCVITGDTGAIDNEAFSAKVYSYSDGEVKYITKMQSTGSGYPLLAKGKYIISGWHHASQRLMVSGAVGYMESSEGFDIEDGDCYKKTWKVVNGKKKNLKSKKISQKKANSLDYYINAFGKSGKTIIHFEKVK